MFLINAPGNGEEPSYLTFNNIEFSIASLFTTTPFKSLQAQEKEGKSNREEAMSSEQTGDFMVGMEGFEPSTTSTPFLKRPFSNSIN
ncbi:hypothetical protein SC429_07375 [Legionella pneumophila]